MFPFSFPPMIMGEKNISTDFWRRPIPLQAKQGLSLNPEGCGQCHKDQRRDWTGSLHSRAVGPGLLGQLSPYEDPQFAASCYFCHAPMTEQSEVVRQKEGDDGFAKNPHFDGEIKRSGVSCGVCHLRDGRVYGPPAKEEVKEEGRDKGEKGHNGFIEADFFQRAEFCAACHQMDEGYELNGKVLTNTYREWKGSLYGEKKIPCQSCHMPERRHLFRGIHDPEMVRRGVTFDVDHTGERSRLLITNAGVGHFFPTYVTPLVLVKGFILDKEGNMIPSSLKEVYIGRQVSLDLSEEVFDTRIAPGETFEFDYGLNGSYERSKLVFEVWVHPDEFYNRFYKALLNDDSGGGRRKEIEEALKMTEDSKYRLYRKELTLSGN